MDVGDVIRVPEHRRTVADVQRDDGRGSRRDAVSGIHLRRHAGILGAFFCCRRPTEGVEHWLPAPVVSDVLAANRPFSTMQSVTVSGLNFATVDATASGSVGLNSCDTASWSSGTSVVCLQTAAATPADSSVVVTASAALIGTRPAGFTFDGGASDATCFGWIVACLELR